MFRSFIYLNEDKMNEYHSMLNRVKERSLNIRGKGNVSLPVVRAEVEIEREKNETPSQTIGMAYHTFENNLSDCEEDTFFDFTNKDYDISTLPQMSIFKIRGCVSIPEQFDYFNVIEQFKGLIPTLVDTSDSKNKLAVEWLKTTNSDIPIIAYYDNITISGKLNTKWLLEEYTDLEEYENLEVTILCKVEGYKRADKVEIFNPAKDFVRLNRAMRRSANLETNENLKPIIADGPVLKAEIIAIYK